MLAVLFVNCHLLVLSLSLLLLSPAIHFAMVPQDGALVQDGKRV